MLKDETYFNFLKSPTAELAAGQMLTLGFDGAKYTKAIGSLFKKFKPGGVILFTQNLENEEQAKTLISDIKKLSEDVTGLPPFVCVDQEGGRVARLPKDMPKFPTARSLGEDGSYDQTFEVYEGIGKALARLGINVDFAPVVDLDTNKNNPVIGDRSFGADPALVSTLGMAAIRGLRSKGVLSCAKHFPGHGDTSLDSHLALPEDTRPQGRFLETELAPFKMAIREDVDMIMTAHVVYPSFDKEYPATLSRKIVTDLLRMELEYDGVIVSDDLDMKAICDRWEDGEAISLAVKAGADMALVCHQGKRQENVYEKLLRMIDGGQLSPDDVKIRLGRLMRAKSVAHSAELDYIIDINR